VTWCQRRFRLCCKRVRNQYMPRKHSRTLPDLFADPFRERVSSSREQLQLLGARFEFESNSRELLGLVRAAYAGLPPHRLSRPAPRLRVGLHLMSRPHRRLLPPQLEMFSGATFLAGATPASSFVALCPQHRAALVGVAPQMLEHPYHTRYELLEFAVFTLAARVQGLVPLHAACVGRGDRGVLLMGSSGSGKSTVALHCLLQGMDFVSEDSVFVAPDSLRATGVANFLHVRAESLRWLARSSEEAAIRGSPVIRRRSGVRKFEVDLRRGGYQLARSPLKIVAVIFLSAQRAGARSLLTPLPKSRMLAELAAAQPYAAHQPQWSPFQQRLSRVASFELRRGRHPREAVETLQRLLETGSR
jgi:hypothetical protein